MTVGMISAVNRMESEAAAWDENRPIIENTVMADSLKSAGTKIHVIVEHSKEQEHWRTRWLFRVPSKTRHWILFINRVWTHQCEKTETGLHKPKWQTDFYWNNSNKEMHVYTHKYLWRKGSCVKRFFELQFRVARFIIFTTRWRHSTGTSPQ